MARGGSEQVPGWFMRHMGDAGQPTSDLSFECFWTIGRSELTFSSVCGPSGAYAARLRCQIVHGRVKHDPPWGILGGFVPRAGTFKEGTRTFVADAVYLLLDT